jgi:hypothetical protein
LKNLKCPLPRGRKMPRLMLTIPLGASVRASRHFSRTRGWGLLLDISNIASDLGKLPRFQPFILIMRPSANNTHPGYGPSVAGTSEPPWRRNVVVVSCHRLPRASIGHMSTSTLPRTQWYTSYNATVGSQCETINSRRPPIFGCSVPAARMIQPCSSPAKS